MNKITPHNDLVLVTGGSGFVAAYCIIELLKAGYRVRTTLRSLNRESVVLNMLKTVGIEPGNDLSFEVADLESDRGWSRAMEGCTYVLHVASPFPLHTPEHEDEIIVPAREGTLRVLRAARNAGVKRVVLTSSFAAIGYSPKQSGEPYNENDWTNPDQDKLGAYIKSKTIAEKAAWNFIASEGKGLELSVINPVGVFGPVLGSDFSTSIQIIKRLLDGSMPGCPRLNFAFVDVRDVADLQLRAMTYPAAKGQRFLATSGSTISMKQIALILKENFPNHPKKIPTREVPDWLLKIFAIFDPAVKQIIPELGIIKQASNEKAKNVLGWQPRSNEESIIATARSLVELNLLKKA